MARYVYIWLPSYYPDAVDSDADTAFFAYVDGNEERVTQARLFQFLTDHADRSFIIYDALRFHDDCLKIFENSREQQQAIWHLSRTYRLWDMAFLARRIEYAKKGYAKKITGQVGLDELVNLYATDVSDVFDRLRAIFIGLIDYAVSELPIFITYWGLGSVVDGVPRNGYDLPSPLTTDEYFELSYAERYFRYFVDEDAEVETIILRRDGQESSESDFFDEFDTPEMTISTDGWPEPQTVDGTNSCAASVPAFRRRDLILTGTTGPLGIGLDCQAAIITAVLNNQTSTGSTNDVGLSDLDRHYKELSQRLKNSSLSGGFHWNEKGTIISLDKKNYISYDRHKLPGRLEKILNNSRSFITGDLTPPYADDWCVFMENTTVEEAKELKEEIARFLRKRTGLELSVEKTLITSAGEGIDFLGFRIIRNGIGDGDVRVEITDKKFQGLCEQVDEVVKDQEPRRTPRGVIEAMNRKINGWAESLCYADNFPGIAEKLDRYIRKQVVGSVSRQRRRKRNRPLRGQARNRRAGRESAQGPGDRLVLEVQGVLAQGPGDTVAPEAQAVLALGPGKRNEQGPAFRDRSQCQVHRDKCRNGLPAPRTLDDLVKLSDRERKQTVREPKPYRPGK